jgi:general secretion pathway protein G
MNQKGFATLEIILMVMVIGILATMAVPQFEKITAAANTSKVQSDLAAIQTAAAVYQMEKGTVPTYAQLTANNATYFENGAPQEPSGKVYIDGTITQIGSTGYDVNSDGKATFAGKTIEHFTSKSSS